MPTLLAVTPHPDDESYSFGGTIARAADDGWRCLVVCASSGEAGERHNGGPLESGSLAATREAELAESCRLLGAQILATLRLPDGHLREVPPPAGALDDALTAAAPDVVLALGADGAYGHPDHLAVYRWVTEAWARLASPPPLLFAAFPRGLFLPQYELCIGMMGDPPWPSPAAIGALRPQSSVDIRGVASRKLAAVAAHRSQLPGGDPYALFPRGIVAALLSSEWFVSAGDLTSAQRSALPAWVRPEMDG